MMFGTHTIARPGPGQPQLAVALDVGTADEIPPILDRFPDSIAWYKVGLELFSAAGPAVLEELQRREKNIFLDLKLHDIPNTVAGTVRSITRLGVQLLTVHAVGGRAMLRAAVEAAAEAGEQRPCIVAVTTLTSLGQDDLRDLGIERPLSDQALSLGQMALDCGIDGLVCSVHEAAALRERIGDGPILVTPGIRLPGEGAGDQKRVSTPDEAVRNGSSLLVVGRSLLRSLDPAAAAARILALMEEGKGKGRRQNAEG